MAIVHMMNIHGPVDLPLWLTDLPKELYSWLQLQKVPDYLDGAGAALTGRLTSEVKLDC